MTRPEHGCKDRAAAGILHRIESLRLSPAPRPLVVIIIALFVAATVALSFVLTGLMLNVDGQDGPGYLARANGAWLQSDDFHGPAYSWAIRVVASFGLEQCRAARLATIGFGALFLIASWRILSSLDRPREAALAVLLLATHPVVIEMGVAIRADMMGASLFLAALALFIGADQPGRWRAALAGAAIGLAYMTRHIYVLGIAIPLVALLLASKDRGSTRRALLATLAFSAGFLATSAPWLWHVASRSEVDFLGDNHRNVAFKVFRDGIHMDRFPGSHEFEGIIDVVSSDPLRFFESWGSSLLHLPYAVAGVFAGLELVCAAGALVWLVRGGRGHLAFLLCCALYGAAISLVAPLERYLLALAPLAAGLVAAAFAWLPNGLPIPWRVGRRWAIPVWPLLAGAVVWIGATRSIDRYRRHAARWDRTEAAARWLRGQAPEHASVLVRDRLFSTLSGARHVDMWTCFTENPNAEFGELLLRENVDFLVMDAHTAHRFPKTSSLYSHPDDNPLSSVLELVYMADHQGAGRVMVFEVRRESDMNDG